MQLCVYNNYRHPLINLYGLRNNFGSCQVYVLHGFIFPWMAGCRRILVYRAGHSYTWRAWYHKFSAGTWQCYRLLCCWKDAYDLRLDPYQTRSLQSSASAVSSFQTDGKTQCNRCRTVKNITKRLFYGQYNTWFDKSTLWKIRHRQLWQMGHTSFECAHKRKLGLQTSLAGEHLIPVCPICHGLTLSDKFAFIPIFKNAFYSQIALGSVKT